MSDLENSINALTRVIGTAVNVLADSSAGEPSDWTTKKDIEHMKNCCLKLRYKELSDAAMKVKFEWMKIKKRLSDKAFQRLLESLEEEKI